MLVLGPTVYTDKWDEAGIEVGIAPLDDDVDRQFLEETVEEIRDENGRIINIKRDPVRYAQLVGKHCIKWWKGVVSDDLTPVDCTPEAIEQFMLIEPVAKRYVRMAKDLMLRRRVKIDEAKKD